MLLAAHCSKLGWKADARLLQWAGRRSEQAVPVTAGTEGRFLLSSAQGHGIT